MCLSHRYKIASFTMNSLGAFNNGEPFLDPIPLCFLLDMSFCPLIIGRHVLLFGQKLMTFLSVCSWLMTYSYHIIPEGRGKEALASLIFGLAGMHWMVCTHVRLRKLTRGEINVNGKWYKVADGSITCDQSNGFTNEDVLILPTHA